MFERTPNEIVDITVFPLAIEMACPDSKKLVVVYGDAHGNSLKILHNLIRHGVIVDISAADYARFVAIYQTDTENVMPADLHFIQMMLSQASYNPTRYIIFIGDVFFDRGMNDCYSIFILTALKNHGVAFEIIFSNHDLLFVEAYEALYHKHHRLFKKLTLDEFEYLRPLIPNTLIPLSVNEYKNIAFTTEQAQEIFSLIPRNNDLQNQTIIKKMYQKFRFKFNHPEKHVAFYRSFLALMKFIERDMITIEEVLSFVEKIYKPSLRIVSYVCDHDNTSKGIIMITHAPIGLRKNMNDDLKCLEALTEQFDTHYMDKNRESLIRTIDAINRTFIRLVENNEITEKTASAQIFYNFTLQEFQTIQARLSITLLKSTTESNYRSIYFNKKEMENILSYPLLGEKIRSKIENMFEIRRLALFHVLYNRDYPQLWRIPGIGNYTIIYAHGHDHDDNQADKDCILVFDDKLGSSLSKHNNGLSTDTLVTVTHSAITREELLQNNDILFSVDFGIDYLKQQIEQIKTIHNFLEQRLRESADNSEKKPWIQPITEIAEEFQNKIACLANHHAFEKMLGAFETCLCSVDNPIPSYSNHTHLFSNTEEQGISEIKHIQNKLTSMVDIYNELEYFLNGHNSNDFATHPSLCFSAIHGIKALQRSIAELASLNAFEVITKVSSSNSNNPPSV